MPKKTIFILLGCLIFSTAIVIVLFAATYKDPYERNSFLRVYNELTAVKSAELDVSVNSYYIAGVTDDRVYLGNMTAPFRLLVTNLMLTDSQHVRINIRELKKPVYKSATVKIDPPFFYLADGIRPALFKGRLGEWEAVPVSYDTNAYFTQLTPVGKTSFAIRTNEVSTLYNILGKVQTNAPQLQLKPGLLQKQVDGIFCTDGMLLYNRNLRRLVYMYYYRNEYLVCDTSLNLDYTGHTIDTFSRAQIKIGHTSSDNKNKLMDKKSTNVRSCTFGNYLFIRSNLLARNDDKEQLVNGAIIDVYDLRNNAYRYSFTLPNLNGEKRLRDFIVFDKMLIALYDHHMVRYDLQPALALRSADVIHREH
jgi:hypothetical protein